MSDSFGMKRQQSVDEINHLIVNNVDRGSNMQRKSTFSIYGFHEVIMLSESKKEGIDL